jgi:twitching motility protein PilT
LHTVDAVETINRIIAVFPPYQQKQIRLQLASVIKGIVSMRLVPRTDGRGRVPAVEVMIATQTIKECIIDPEKTRKIHDVVASGSTQYGMQTFDQSLYFLYQKRLISYEEALQWCTNPDDFALKVKGIESTSDVAAGGMQKKPDESDFKVERFGGK